MERRKRHPVASPFPRRSRGAAVAGILAAGGAFAGLVGPLPDPTPEQLLLLAVASAITGTLTFVALAQAQNVPSRTGRRSSAHPHDVLLSFMAVDRAWAEWVQEALEKANLRVCLQRWDFWPGQNLTTRAEEALRQADVVIVIASRAFAAASYAGITWTRAIAPQRSGRDRLLVLQVHPIDRARLDQDPELDIAGLSPDAVADGLLALLAQHGVGSVEPPASESTPGTSIRFPAWGPETWNLPARNPHFTGRDELLDELRQALLQPSSNPMVQGRALHGLGGVGKTQIAVEYAHRYASSYDLAWWIPAEQDASIANALRGLAGQLGVREDAEQDEMLVALWEGLRRTGCWLLVFDNAEDARELERSWPRSGTGHVLVTSRNPAMGGLVPTILVPPLSPDEATAFLQKRTGSEDVVSATGVAEDLGYLPLALEQAGAYVEEMRTSLPEYRERLKERASEHRDRLEERTPDVFAVGQPSYYEQTVRTTWSMAQERAEAEAPAALDLLTLCSFLAPEDIPRDLGLEHAEQLPPRAQRELGTALGHDLAVRALSRFSLIDADADAVSVHRLVQTIVRDSLDPEQERMWAEVAVRVLHAAIPERRDSSTWPRRARLLPHVVAATERAQALGVAADETGFLLQWTGEYEHERGQFLEAKEHLEEALALRRRTHHERHINVAATLNSLARLEYHLAHLERARAYTEDALAIRRDLLGEDDPQVADSLSHLGRVLRELGDFPNARKVAHESLDIRLRLKVQDHAKVADCRHLLGVIMWRQGDLTGARHQHQQALDLRETHCGQDSVEAAASLKHLGLVHREVGAATGRRAELEVARTLFERALTIFEGTYGSDHVDTADLQSNLGGILRRMGELRPARSLLEKAIATREATVGRDHPDVGGSLVELGGVLRGLGDRHSAKAVLERALGIYERTYGPKHPYVAEALEALGPVVRDLGDTASADALAARARQVREGRAAG